MGLNVLLNFLAEVSGNSAGKQGESRVSSASQLSYYIVGGVLALLILGLDLMLPLGVAAGVPYLFLVLMAWKIPDKKFLYFAAITGTILTMIGLALSPSGGEMWKVLANRFLALTVVWGSAILGVIHKKQEEELTQTNRRFKEEIIQRAQAEENLKKSENQLRELCSHMESLREEERFRVAREIHDELGQVLTAVKLEIAVLRDNLPEDTEDIMKVRENIASLLSHADNAIQTVKKISGELRPFVLDNLGLREAIEWEVEKFEQRTKIQCSLVLDFDDQVLESDRAITIFRIFQETLTNVIRHAQASRVNILLKEHDGEIRMAITDDGCGVTEDQIASKEAFGLIGMRERAFAWGGDFSIKGESGRGTEVRVRIPLPTKSAIDDHADHSVFNHS